jgi:hypothetical protein
MEKKMTSQSIGKILRISNLAGPCIEEGRIIRETEKFYVVQPTRTGRPQRIGKGNPEFDGYNRHQQGCVHVEPCVCCTDHPETHYPNGYEN